VIEHQFDSGPGGSSVEEPAMSTSRTTIAAGGAPRWVQGINGYELALDPASGALVCRSATGRPLKRVPKPVRESAAAEHLLALRDWLARHEAECRETVERWMLGSMPVPSAVLVAVWPDPAWRCRLEHAVIAPAGEDGRPDPGGMVGFLRGVDPDGRAGVVDVDGETRWLDAVTVSIPHPVLLDDLDELRELAVELGVEQGIQQLLREVHRKPAVLDPGEQRVSDFADGCFAEARHVLARAANLGFQVRGGSAVCRAFDAGAPVEARYWLGADDPYWEAWTGDLVWVDGRERQLDLAHVGPVAWSEGIRMASLIYAGRVAGEGEE
jgi:Domain of unknown function (DUF4132)